jgi:hypothetical protein
VYFPGLEIVGILLLGGFAWLWFDSLKAREAAMGAARAACASEGLLLLDDTVAISVLSPARGEDGRLTLRRAYDFEYSDTGNNRLKGSIVLLGYRVVVLNLGWRIEAGGRTLH